jgi:hypothetical protein
LLGGLLDASLQSSPEISQSLQGAGVAAVGSFAGRAAAVMKKLSISVFEDDLFVLGSVGRLMRSLGYTTEAFPLAADFPRISAS